MNLRFARPRFACRPRLAAFAAACWRRRAIRTGRHRRRGAIRHATPRANPHWVEPSPDAFRGRRGGPTRSLDFLFGALKVAPDDDSAKTIEDRIWAQWLASGSDTVNLLMNRAKTAVEGKRPRSRHPAARRRRSRSGRNMSKPGTGAPPCSSSRRTTASALVDLRKVLALEPRHFGALAGLGMILQDIGDEKHALDAYRRAVEVHPRLKGMDDKIKSLTEKVDGRDI